MSASRPLRTAREAVESLRASTADPRAAAVALRRVVYAVENVLRRRLRDDPKAELDLRLSALAPDEVGTETVIDELRRRDHISLELAAGFHELVRLRQQLERGATPAAGDVERAVELVGRLESEMVRTPAPHDPRPQYAAPATPQAAPAARPYRESPEREDPQDDGAADGRPLGERPFLTRVPTAVWLSGILSLFVLVLLGGWLITGPQTNGGLEEGIVLFRSGAYAEAEPHFRRHAEARPNDPTPRLYLARIYRRLRDFERAATELRLALEVAPDDPGLHREVGFLLLDTGQPAAAADRFRTAVAADPESTEGWLGLIRSLREAGRPDAAQQIIERAPDEVRVLLVRPAPAPPPAS
jgi:hypothetical protein